MAALLSLARLELFFSVRKKGFWIYYLLFFGLLFLFINLLGGAFPSVQISGDSLKFNSPAFINGTMGTVGLLSTFIVSSYAGMGALRDYRYNSYLITFSYPVSRSGFILGKFLGIYAANLLLFTAPLLGYALATLMPWLNRSLFLPFDGLSYLNAFLRQFVVNIFFLTALFFSLGLLLRSILINWVIVIACYLLYFLGSHYFGQSGTRTLGALLDPYGIVSAQSVDVGSSAEQHNTDHVSFSGLYLWNRLLWLGVGMLSLVAALLFFRFRTQVALPTKRRKTGVPSALLEPPTGPAPGVQLWFGRSFGGRVFRNQLWMELRQFFRNPYLYLLLFGMGLFLYFGSSILSGDFEGSSYPTTIRVVSNFADITHIFIILTILLLSGETVWRDTQYRMHGIISAFPARPQTRFAARTITVFTVVLTQLILILLAGLLYQASHSYTRFEMGLYTSYLFGYSATHYLFYCVLAVALNMLSGSKFGGYAVFGGVYLFSEFFAYRLFRHGMLAPGYTPSVQYSDLTGYNGSFGPYIIYCLYWLAGAVLLWRLGSTLLQYAEGEGWKARWSRAWSRRPSAKPLTFWVLLALFIGLGGFIFYNTDIRNENHTAKYQQQLQADYERRYSRLRTVPQASIARVEGTLQLYPSARRFTAQMQLTLLNKTSRPVDTIYFNLPDKGTTFEQLQANRSWKPLFRNEQHDFWAYALDRPLLPGDSLLLSYRYVSPSKGFTDQGLQASVLPNGTFLNSSAFLPLLGYDPSKELTGAALRKQYHLPPKPYMPVLEDTVAQQENFFSASADRIWLSLTLATDTDQTAIAPGYLRKQWKEGDRAFFRYEIDAPAVNYFSIQSGRYAVRTQDVEIKDGDTIQPVKLSVYYHPAHAYNVNVFLRAMQDGLQTYTTAFGPYPYRQLRLVEFPEASFAQSFANTIPFAENIGFITDLRTFRNNGTDSTPNFPYFITLHEVAHQWWGHQILPAATEGAQFLSESISQYSAIMAYFRTYGYRSAQKILEHYNFEYLTSRGRESQEERPLMRVLTQQYIYYAKGLVVMNGLRQYLGEDRVNAVLRSFMQQYKFKERPYVTADKLVALLKSAAPDSLRYLVTDGLERIVVYNNTLQSAGYRLNKETLEYQIEAHIKGKKLTYTNKGKSTETPMADYIDLGVLDRDGKQVATHRVRLQSGSNTIRFTTSRRPSTLSLNPSYGVLDLDYNHEHQQVDVIKL